MHFMAFRCSCNLHTCTWQSFFVVSLSATSYSSLLCSFTTYLNLVFQLLPTLNCFPFTTYLNLVFQLPSTLPCFPLLQPTSICWTVRSRKVSSDLTGMMDLGPWQPMEVPRPPLSFTTTSLFRSSLVRFFSGCVSSLYLITCSRGRGCKFSGSHLVILSMTLWIFRIASN